MTTLQNGDSFLVQRTDSQSGISTNYQVSQENLMANLADDDLLLVQRTSAGISTNYCISGSDLKEDLGGTNGLIRPPVAVLTPLNGSGITEFTQYEPLSSAITVVGEAGTIVKDTDEILSVADVSDGAVVFDGNDLLTVPGFTTAPQGTNNWTIEFYAYFDFGSNSSSKTVTWTGETSHPNYRISVQVENGKYYLVDSGNYGGSWYSSKNDLASYTSVVAPSNKWHHVAIQRASGVDTIYIDGQVQFTASGHTGSSPSVTGNWIIGGGQASSNHMIGKLSNFRVLSGTALYSSTFTPPATPLTNITNTVLLCCQSGSSATAAAVSTGTLTTTGDPTATSDNVTGQKVLSFPTNTNFSGLSVGDVVSGANDGGSLYLDGDAVIKISDDSNAANIFDIPDYTAFTIEAWVYPTNLGSYNNIMSGWDSSNNYEGVLFHILDSGQIFFGGFAGVTRTSSASNPVTLNNWHHVAVTRDNGNAGEFYIDGVSAGTFSDNRALNHNSGVFIGANMDSSADGSGGNPDYRWTGYISNLRYVVGHETYTSNFTPSTEPLTPTSQGVPAGACKFLACQDATSFDTNSMGVPMTADYGTPVASGQNPFGETVAIIAIDASAPSQTTEYATWDPLGGQATFSNGNLDVSVVEAAESVYQTIFPQSGKYYIELDFVSGGGGGGGLRMGVINENNIGLDLGSTANSWAYLADGRTYHNGGAAGYGVSSSPGDLLMMALDIDAGKLWFGKNGVWMASGDPVAGANPSHSFASGQKMSFSVNSASGTQVISANFGATAFTHTPPSGYAGLSEVVTTYPSVTVNGGTWDTSNQSEVWSTFATNPSSQSSIAISNGFDGKVDFPSNITYAAYSGASFPAQNVSFDIPILATDTIRIKVQSDLGPFFVDAGNGTVSFPAGSGSYYLDISSAFTSDVTSWKIGSGHNWNFSGIEINGKLLVDSGVSVPGDRRLSSAISYEKSLTFTDDTQLANMVGPFEMTDANGDVVTPVSDTIANVSGNVLTLQGDTNLAYFQPGDEVQTGVEIVSVDAAAPSITVDGGSWLGADGSGSTYEISKSLRFNSADSAYLSRTPSITGSTTTWTLSFWIKRVKSGGTEGVFMSYNGSSIAEADYANINFNSSDQLVVGYAMASYKTTNRVFRDFSSWHHIVVRLETGNSTASDRVQIYVNGVKETSFAATNDPVSGQSLAWNKAHIHRIGSEYGQFYADCYFAEVHFVDGTAHDADSFGGFDSNNVWQAKEFSGTYGTNGFHLDFSDNSSNAALGYDAAGSNDWTVTNLQATGGNLNLDISTSLELYVQSYSPSANTVSVNGIDVTSQITVGAWSTITGVGTTLNSIKTTGNTAGTSYYALTAVKVNGKWLIDTGTSNPPTPNIIGDWSTNFLAAVGYTSRPIQRAFNGVLGNYTQSFVGQVGGGGGGGIDSLVDTPTNYGTDSGLGGEVGGNYCVWNPLNANYATLSQGNLEAALTGGGGNENVRGTIAVSSGKYYWENTFTATSNTAGSYGVVSASVGSNIRLDATSGTNAVLYMAWNGSKAVNGTASAYGAAYTVNDVIGVALDLDEGTITFYKNNVSQGVINLPATGIAYTPTFAFEAGSGNAATTTNFGQRPFAYAAPSGYKALTRANLPVPSIKDGSDYFGIVTYAGNGGTQTVSGLNFSPDLVWYKTRDGAFEHGLQDSVRGVGKSLSSSNSGEEHTESNGITAFTSDGFTLNGTGYYYANSNNEMVAWCWNAGDTTETIAAGGLNSSVYDQSQTWSNGKDGDRGDYPVANVFDGSLTTVGYGAVNQTITVTLPGGPIDLTSLRVKADRLGTATGKFYVNGNDYTSQIASGINWNTITGETSITSIGYGSDTGSNFVGLFAVEVNGKQLVDYGVSASTPSIASEVRSSPESGFSIISYTGNNTSGATIGHGLNAAVEFAIFKQRGVSNDWSVYHKGAGATGYLRLNTTDSFTTTSGQFNDTHPSSSVITLGSDHNANGPSNPIICYAWAPVEGYSAMGKYQGNGDANGSFVYTGFKPAFVMVKNITYAHPWQINDIARDVEMPNRKALYPNTSAAENQNNSAIIDILGNGFKLRGPDSYVNASNSEYIYIAFAEHPFNTTPEVDTSGDTQVALDPLAAIATEIVETDGTTMYLNGATGPWRTGLSIEGSQINAAPPGPNEVTFTSTDNGTTPVSMIDATLSTRTWTLESGTTATGPWTLIDSYTDFDAIDSQDGATPWTTTRPTLQPNTFYRIKVRYDSLNADSVESVYNTFKTGDA